MLIAESIHNLAKIGIPLPANSAELSPVVCMDSDEVAATKMVWA